MLQDRGALPTEEGDVVREYKAMHEEQFLSSWSREDGKDKKERNMVVDRETKEDVSKTRKREEKEENETVIVKRRCVNAAEAFDINRQEEVSESCGNSWSDLLNESCGLSDCDSVTWTGCSCGACVPYSAVAVMCEGVSSDSDWAGAKKILADASLEKQGYKVSDNRNLPSEMFWSKSKEMRTQAVPPKRRGEVTLGVDPLKNTRSLRESGKG